VSDGRMRRKARGRDPPRRPSSVRSSGQKFFRQFRMVYNIPPKIPTVCSCEFRGLVGRFAVRKKMIY